MEPEYLDDLTALNKDGGDYIRLLRVLAPISRPQEAMLCELRVFSLSHAPKYFALSYCRQPEDDAVIIEVRGSLEGSFPVSCDLESATRALCEFRPSDWFWIDAMCINQLSNNEKNDQVPRMREIYEMAHAGMIWLGIDVQSKVEYTFRWGSTDLVHLENGDIVSLEVIEPKTGSKEARDADLGPTHAKVMQLARLAEHQPAESADHRTVGSASGTARRSNAAGRSRGGENRSHTVVQTQQMAAASGRKQFAASEPSMSFADAG
jgi:hypothetical protein